MSAFETIIKGWVVLPNTKLISCSKHDVELALYCVRPGDCFVDYHEIGLHTFYSS